VIDDGKYDSKNLLLENPKMVKDDSYITFASALH
jgi:hypothetical protein